MKLYLSSYRLGDRPQALRDLAGPGHRAGIVMNACDHFDDRLLTWPRERNDLCELGYDVVEIDLGQHFGADSPIEELSELDLLWVVGGNAFVLARAMNASGFGRAISEMLSSGRLTYAGYSAGVCVTTPGLEGIDLIDDPAIHPQGYPADARADTLGWVPWHIVPHWNSEHPDSSSAVDAADHLLAAGMPFRTLQDGRAIVVDGDLTTDI